MTENLTKALLERIFGNIGAGPGNQFGQVGITSKEYLSNKKLKIKENKEILECSIWSGKLAYEGYTYLISLSKIKDEFVMTLITNDEVFSFYLGEESNFYMNFNGEWVGINMQHKLNLTLFFEIITQAGYLWKPEPEVEKSYMYLAGTIEHVER